MSSGEPALLIRDLAMSFPDPDGGADLEVLRVPQLDLGAGEALAVLGESGSGKTTLLHVVAGILPTQQGTVRVCGDAMSGVGELARDRLRARHVGYLFQTFNLLPHLSALENVALGMAFRSAGSSPIHDAARHALERVGLADRMGHRPAQLSVGQRQRVAIARALAGQPGLVLADEPTANLDARHATEALDVLLSFAAECKAALLAVTHDPRALERFSSTLALHAPGGES